MRSLTHPKEQRSIDPSNLEPNRKRAKTGGRQRGSLNKTTRDIKALAGKHTPEALNTLVSVMQASESDAARVSAAKELLDRAHGRPAQAIIGGDENDPAIRVITEIRRSIVDPRHTDG